MYPFLISDRFIYRCKANETWSQICAALKIFIHVFVLSFMFFFVFAAANLFLCHKNLIISFHKKSAIKYFLFDIFYTFCFHNQTVKFKRFNRGTKKYAFKINSTINFSKPNIFIKATIFFVCGMHMKTLLHIYFSLYNTTFTYSYEIHIHILRDVLMVVC